MSKISDYPQLLKWVFLIAFLFILGGKAKAQFYAVKVDVLGLCTTTLNVEGSMAIHNQWTLHLPIRFNPWIISEKSFKNITALPGVRYWLIDGYARGWFFGANAVLTSYNVSGLVGDRIDYFSTDYRYKGKGYGIGLSAGYSVPIKKRINLEFEAGVAGVYVDHDIYSEFDGRACGYQKGILPVPGKIGINLVYLF